MKVRHFILLCLMVSLTFCACKKQSTRPGPHSTDTSTFEQSGSAPIEPQLTPTQSLLRISDHLSSITDISDEWLPGCYLIYGTDFYGSLCYGILDVNGGFSILNGYAAYYPLAGGNLLVTNETDIERSLKTSSHKTTDIALAK